MDFSRQLTNSTLYIEDDEFDRLDLDEIRKLGFHPDQSIYDTMRGIVNNPSIPLRLRSVVGLAMEELRLKDSDIQLRKYISDKEVFLRREENLIKKEDLKLRREEFELKKQLALTQQDGERENLQPTLLLPSESDCRRELREMEEADEKQRKADLRKNEKLKLDEKKLERKKGKLLKEIKGGKLNAKTITGKKPRTTTRNKK